MTFPSATVYTLGFVFNVFLVLASVEIIKISGTIITIVFSFAKKELEYNNTLFAKFYFLINIDFNIVMNLM